MQIVETYKLLADESRLRLLSILSRGYFNVQELTSILDLGQSTVSHHLKLLTGAGLTRKRKEGTWTYYTLSKNDSPALPEKIVGNFIEASRSINGEDSLSEHLAADKQSVREVLTSRRDETREFFNTAAIGGDELRPEVSTEDLLVDLIREKIGDDSAFADLGCGSGPMLKSFLPREGETVGVDYSEAILDKAKEVLGKYSDSVDLRLGYLEHLPIADESMDFALTYMVLHHVPAPVEALAEAHRILAPGGELLIVDLMPHSNDEMRERYGDRWLGFEPKEFHKWIEECGFECAQFEVFGENNEVFYLNATKSSSVSRISSELKK